MKFASKSYFLVLASAAALLSGCTKKPVRPDPSATMMGPNTGGPGANGGINPNAIATGGDDGSLSSRNAFDASGQDRTSLEAVYFDFNQSSVKASERDKLKAAKEKLAGTPTLRILLEGHCDWRGTSEYNLALGDRRANEAKKYLLTLGVTADKIDTLSKGSEEASKNADDAAMAKDRRVELVLLSPGAAATAPAAGAAPVTK